MMWTLSLLSLIGILVAPSTASLTGDEFSDLIEPMCFKNEDSANTLLVNGQEVPLASTLENFISLVEKIELASTTMTIEEELFYLLRSFMYENIYFTRGKIFPYKPASVEYTVVNTLWERDVDKRERQPVEVDALSNQERCSLFFMMSHTVMLQAMKVDKNVDRSVDRTYVNTTFSGPSRSDEGTMDDLYPYETGVVAVRGSDQAVALGRVLLGLYVGLRNEDQRRIPLDSLKKIPASTIYTPPTDQVDPLVLLTLAEPLVIAKWPFESNRDELAKNGVWKASPSAKTIHDTVEVCPSVYKLDEMENSMYSYSSVRGAADGLILGQIINDLVNQRSSIRLSQILRMYYSPRGIRTLQANNRETGSVSFCARRQLIDSLESTLQEQMELFAFLVGSAKEVKDTVQKAWNYYFGLKTDIYGDQRVNNGLCPLTVDAKNPERKYPLETPMDFLVVLDSQNSITTQQLIVGHLANHLELRSGGGTMTVLLDQREGTSGLKLRPIVNETFNVACAACMVTQTVDGSSAADRDIVIQAIDEYLQNRKKAEENRNGVKGKIVVYFNLLDDEKENYRLSRALKSFHLSHQDVSIYALGKETEVLKKYTKNDLHHIISTADQPADVAHNLFDKLVKDPAILQYTDCKNARGESGSTFEEFVSPYSVQHWAMPAKYFLKSSDIKFFFEAEYGHLQVCYSRADSSPENQQKNCKNTNGSVKKLEFKDSNPCSGFNEITCEPMYFSVMGMNASDNSPSNQFCQDTQTAKCKSLDQVKFKVTHDGIRCSGTTGLLSSTILMVVAFLILQILTRKD